MYFLDLLGTLAFAITGAFKAKKGKLSLFGVIFLGIITAVGGGTVRDLIINRTPLFYLIDSNYLFVAILGSIITFLAPTFFKKRLSIFRFIDSIGLATFSIIGVSVTYNYIFADTLLQITSFLSCVLLGMVTAFAGGVIRDAVMGDTPFAFKTGSNYALSSFLGASVFYLLMFYSLNLAIALSIITAIFMREIVSKYGMYRKVLKGKAL
ncbi:MAG: TRIC cation channel family protein [Candidatus Nealsonbacteria bacterium]